MSAPYQLFGIGQHSKSPNLTAQHRLNLYLDVQTDADKTQVAAYGTPGLSLYCAPSGQVTRGMHWMEANNTLYVVQRGNLYSVQDNNGLGNATLLASLTISPTQDISGPVSMANNGIQLCIVTGSYVYIWDTGLATLRNITLSGNLTGQAAYPYNGNAVVTAFPYSGNSADTVTFLDGFFIINRPNTGQFYVSGSLISNYDGSSWQGLNFATAESNPDNLQAVIADKGHLVLLGSSSTEIWVNSGGATFPFSRVNASPSDGGLAARWSLSRCKGMVTGLFRNKQGALSVAVLDGYTLTAISNTDMDYLINGYTTPEDAVGFGYTINGKAFYQITFQAQAVSWLYDFQSQAWSQLKSWGISRHIGAIGVSFGTRFIVSDYATGNLYTLSSDALTDNGSPIEREITGHHTFSQSRNSLIIRRLRLDMEGGVGLLTGQGTTPEVMLQISRDGGHTWGAPMLSNIGALADFVHRAEWRRLGKARDWVFKIRITDPVKTVIIGAIIEAQELGS